jgi:hypothetical protein
VKHTKKKLQILASIVIIAVIATTLVYFTNTPTFVAPKGAPFTPHYISYRGNPSKIYVAAAATSYSKVNESYSAEGQEVKKGTPLFIVSVTLRNDYTADDLPPPNGTQVFPADGTAYLYLNAQLYDKNGLVNATNVSVSDFSVPKTIGTGLVLASGQTASTDLWIATDNTKINQYYLTLVFLGDSIPT